MREVLGNFQWRVRAFVLLLLDIIAMGVASFLALWVQSEFVVFRYRNRCTTVGIWVYAVQCCDYSGDICTVPPVYKSLEVCKCQ